VIGNGQKAGAARGGRRRDRHGRWHREERSAVGGKRSFPTGGARWGV